MKLRLLLILTLATVRLCAQDLALVHARIYQGPEAAVIPDGTVVIEDGWISAVGPSQSVKAPANVRLIDCSGLTAVAGFWNSHVHFTEDKWQNARALPAATLSAQLVEMLARYGFTAAFDTGSDTLNTIAMRERIRAEEVAGPMILTAGTPLAPPGGTPYYVKPTLLPELGSVEEAQLLTRERMNQGVDAIKIFSGSWISKEKTVTMPLDFVSAISAAAHRFGLPVFAHPSDAAGLRAAVDGGVDILAHAEEVPGTVDAETLGKMMRQNMALIPTLKLFAEDETLPKILQQVKSYSERGGEILFGTDAGYLKDYDPSGEYQLLARAGLSFRQILAALTTAPAHRFGFSRRKGRLETQMDADIVLLAGDPAESPASFASVRYCLRGGRVLFSSPAR